MEITRKNYFDLLPNIKKAISEAEFLAIDLEFTGLSSAGRDLEDKPFDTPRQYYEKLFQRALDFLPLQLGLCIFKKDSDGERFTYDAYNFYSYPFSDLKGFPDITFQCQSSSLAFLSSFGFDFNKTIREGIPFLTQPQEDNLKASIEERQKKMVKDVKDLVDIIVPDDLKTQFDRNIIKIKEFLEDSAGLGENCLTLERCNGLMRRLLFQEVPKEFGDAVHLETCDKSNYAMKVMRGGGEDQKKVREEKKIKGEWEAFDKAIGLSHLIKEISKSGKLIIGHNALLDICHLVNRFRYPLPFNYDSFKEMVHLIFPRIIDTKFMCTAPEFKNLISSGPLGQLRDTLLEAPFQMPLIEGNVKEYSYCDLVDKSHEGAYDAYISGQCFLAMCQYLAKSEGKKFDNTDCIKDILSRFENRLFLMRVQDVPYITLGGPDPKPPRNHVFHLQFPQEWRHSEIAELFKPFGSVFVSFIDNQSAFVALQRKDQAKVVLKKLTGNDDYKITSFNAYQKQFERISPPPTKPASPSLAVLRKRKLRESADTPELPSVFKKHCVPEQPKRSIDPIPEESELDNTVTKTPSPKLKETSSEISKEFLENQVWD